MYAILGDKEGQDNIRSQYRNESHCAWLRKCPAACDSFPDLSDVDDDPEMLKRAGKPCPNNPYIRHKDLIEEGARGYPFITHADTCLDELEWGLTSPQKLGPKDFEWAKVAKRMQKLKDAELLSKMIAYEVSKVFGDSK